MTGRRGAHDPELASLRAELDRVWAELERRLKREALYRPTGGDRDLMDRLMSRIHVDRTTFKASVIGEGEGHQGAHATIAQLCDLVRLERRIESAGARQRLIATTAEMPQ